MVGEDASLLRLDAIVVTGNDILDGGIDMSKVNGSGQSQAAAQSASSSSSNSYIAGNNMAGIKIPKGSGISQQSYNQTLLKFYNSMTGMNKGLERKKQG